MQSIFVMVLQSVPINLLALAHALNDFELSGSWFDGQYIKDVAHYFCQFLQSYMEEKKSVAEEIRTLYDNMLVFLDYARNLSTIQDLAEHNPGLSRAQVAQLSQEVRTSIINMSDRLFFPGNWTNLGDKDKPSSAHSLIYEFRKKQIGEEQYLWLSVYNGGGGLHHHVSFFHEGYYLDNPALTYQIPLKQIETEGFQQILSQLITLNIACFNPVDVDEDYVYKRLLPQLHSLADVQLLLDNEVPIRCYTIGQRGGTCSQAVIYELLKTQFQCFDDYLNLIHQYKWHMLEHYFKNIQTKNVLDREVVSQLTFAIHKLQEQSTNSGEKEKLEKYLQQIQTKMPIGLYKMPRLPRHIPIQQFIYDEKTPVRSEYYPLVQDEWGLIREHYVTGYCRARRRKIPEGGWGTSLTTQNLNLDDFGNPIPYTPANLVYLGYYLLAMQQPKQALNVLEQIDKLQGEQQELIYIEWIFNGLPRVLNPSQESVTIDTMEYVVCKLQVLSLLCPYLLRKDLQKRFAMTAAQANTKQECYERQEQLLVKKFTEQIEELMSDYFWHYYRFQYDSLNPDLLPAKTHHALLQYYHLRLNPETPSGSMGYQWMSRHVLTRSAVLDIGEHQKKEIALLLPRPEVSMSYHLAKPILMNFQEKNAHDLEGAIQNICAGFPTIELLLDYFGACVEVLQRPLSPHKTKLEGYLKRMLIMYHKEPSQGFYILAYSLSCIAMLHGLPPRRYPLQTFYDLALACRKYALPTIHYQEMAFEWEHLWTPQQQVQPEIIQLPIKRSRNSFFTETNWVEREKRRASINEDIGPGTVLL